MKKRITRLFLTLIAMGLITFFIPHLKLYSYALFALAFGTQIYVAYKYTNKTYQLAAVTATSLLTLLAISKFFDNLN